jgi:primosomal protein N' (replication factor Y)
MSHFIDVILPLPLRKMFAYRINAAEADFVQRGMRVAVPFGKSKIYTGIIDRIHQDEPGEYEVRDIEFIVDDEPIVTTDQLKLWEWISSYYLCSVGQVMRAALPKSLLLESETVILKNDQGTYEEADLNDKEYLVLEALEHRSALKVKEVMDILDRKSVLPLLRTMLDKDLILLKEEVYSTYKPKIEKYMYLHPDYKDEEKLKELLDDMTRAHQQRKAIMTLFMLKAGTNKEVTKKQLQERADVSAAVIKQLVEKNLLIEVQKSLDRVLEERADGEETYNLNEDQQKAYDHIEKSFENNKVGLLHGVTSSGKTEIYVKLIAKMLGAGKQCLYLLPEIALTTQLISRLKVFFKHRVLVYHSKYNLNERLEVWNHIINASEPYVIIGARSAVLLPFQNLGLIIVDEEHENSFKQFDPAPRYHARDTAIVLGNFKKARILLGSATPSLESYFNASKGKYELVELKKRFGNVLMPEIQMIDLKEKHHKKRMKGHFSDTLIEHIQEAFANNNQVILFQNRRGFAPIMECETCGNAPQCPNCDVSLTYHQYKGQLRCHYCGYHTAVPKECPSCTSTALNTKGFGTEQVEQEFIDLFPEHRIARMDLDTTRGKNSYEKLIGKVDKGEVHCLVGTQMVTKGLDFRNVSLVGVMNADSMLNFPDFRAHERCFQLLTQVAGRAGRTKERGKVLIQSYNPSHMILQQVSSYDYTTMFREQLEDRYQFKYPPYQRLIRITFKHRDYNRTQEAAQWFVNALQQIGEGVEVLGPEFPAVARVRNLYLVHVIIKMNNQHSPAQVKTFIYKVQRSFEAIALYRAVRCNIDVDCY